MSLDLVSLPIAFAAGALGILSPCVWPIVPVVVSSAATSGKSGPLWLALGLSVSFAVAGTLLTFLLVSLGLDPELFRYVAAVLLGFVGLSLLWHTLGDAFTRVLSSLTGRLKLASPDGEISSTGQFGVGALLGLVWLPCVGPTLGAAIALASMGENLGASFAVMFVFGLGTASVILLAAMASGKVLGRLRPGVMSAGGKGKKALGLLLLVLALLVVTGADRVLEAATIGFLPDWAVSM